MMRRLLPVALTLLSPVGFAQTTLDITVPGGQVCSYATGPVSNGSASGHLQAIATSSSGAGCGIGSGSVTFGPASPVSASAVQAFNGTSTVTFQALNATSCTGSITPNSGSFTPSAQLCTGATACALPITATAQFNNPNSTAQNYTVAVTCSGTGGVATSQAIVSVPGHDPQTGCYSIANSAGGTPFTRMTAPIATNRNDGNTVNRDSTSFDSIFATATSPHWPGGKVTTNIFLPTTNYVALAFTVPANFFSTPPNDTGVIGEYSLNASNFSKAFVAMSISTKCGDFSAPSPSSSTLCVANNLYSDDFITWTSAAGSSCRLENGKSYYLNIINASVENVLPNGGGTATSTANSHCAGNKCEDTPTNTMGSWH